MQGIEMIYLCTKSTAKQHFTWGNNLEIGVYAQKTSSLSAMAISEMNEQRNILCARLIAMNVWIRPCITKIMIKYIIHMHFDLSFYLYIYFFRIFILRLYYMLKADWSSPGNNKSHASQNSAASLSLSLSLYSSSKLIVPYWVYGVDNVYK